MTTTLNRGTPACDGKIVFSGKDAYNPVEVIDSSGIRSLYFGTQGCQSEMSLKNPYALLSDYAQVMFLSLLFQPSPRSLLMLGLGGGSLPKIIWKSLPRCQIDVVERSPLVADVCFRYFDFPKSPRLQIKLMDALDFLSTSERKYDLLFIDLFDSDGVPECLGQSSFFTLCRNQLKNKKSILVWNFLRGSSEVQTGRFLSKVAASFDGNIILLPTKNGRNYILLAFPNSVEFPTPWEMMQRITKLESKIDFPFLQVWNEIEKVIGAALTKLGSIETR